MSFNRMVQDLRRMEADRELLLAGVSHDLRTPITRLRLEVELADLPEDSRTAMVSDLEQMENIVNQFLSYARHSHEEQELVNLGEAVQNAMSNARLASDSTVKITSHIAPKRLHRCSPARALPRRAEPLHERDALRPQRGRHPQAPHYDGP